MLFSLRCDRNAYKRGLKLSVFRLLQFISHSEMQQVVRICSIKPAVLMQGLWEHNRMHGQGIYTDAEGHQWSGQFFNGSGPGLTCLL